MTNGERIRKAETDEQLATVLGERMPNACPPFMRCRTVGYNCFQCWRAWLAQEEENDS